MNFILIDAEYLDYLAFDIIVNFERMLNRQIRKGDLCHWLDCIALDGGLLPAENELLAAFIHEKENSSLKNFQPSSFETELTGMAFKDNLGEFTLASFCVEELTTKSELFVQMMQTALEDPKTEKLMVVADMDKYGSEVMKCVANKKGSAEITLFTMEPHSNTGFCKYENLGYSVMSALGITADDID